MMITYRLLLSAVATATLFLSSTQAREWGSDFRHVFIHFESKEVQVIGVVRRETIDRYFLQPSFIENPFGGIERIDDGNSWGAASPPGNIYILTIERSASTHGLLVWTKSAGFQCIPLKSLDESLGPKLMRFSATLADAKPFRLESLRNNTERLREAVRKLQD